MKKIVLLIGLFVLFACNNNEKTNGVTTNADSLDWVKTVEKNTVNDYNKFIKQYPESKYVSEANENIAKIEEDSLWQIALNSNTIEAFRNFCSKYPTSNHHAEAYDKVNKILKSQMDTKYKKMVIFLEDITNNFSYQTLSKYKNDKFYLIKHIENNTVSPLQDSVLINEEQFDKKLNSHIFSLCLNLFNKDVEGNKSYDLSCTETDITITFHPSCGDIDFQWLILDNDLKLYAITMYQEVLDCP